MAKKPSNILTTSPLATVPPNPVFPSTRSYCDNVDRLDRVLDREKGQVDEVDDINRLKKGLNRIEEQLEFRQNSDMYDGCLDDYVEVDKKIIRHIKKRIMILRFKNFVPHIGGLIVLSLLAYIAFVKK